MKTYNVLCAYTGFEYPIAANNALVAVQEVAIALSGRRYLRTEQTVWGKSAVSIGDYVANFDGSSFLSKEQ